MTLEQLLKTARGDYELTIGIEGGRVGGICEDEEIPDEENVNYADYVYNWNVHKTAEVVEYRLAPNRNYNGAAIWITVRE